MPAISRQSESHALRMSQKMKSPKKSGRCVPSAVHAKNASVHEWQSASYQLFVGGDAHLLTLRRWRGISIQTPAEYVAHAV